MFTILGLCLVLYLRKDNSYRIVFEMDHELRGKNKVIHDNLLTAFLWRKIIKRVYNHFIYLWNNTPFTRRCKILFTDENFIYFHVINTSTGKKNIIYIFVFVKYNILGIQIP